MQEDVLVGGEFVLSLINEEGSGNEKGKDITGGRGKGKEIRAYIEVLMARIQCVSEGTVGSWGSGRGQWRMAARGESNWGRARLAAGTEVDNTQVPLFFCSGLLLLPVLLRSDFLFLLPDL